MAQQALANNISSSFVECVNSAANQVMGNGRALLWLLCPDELSKLVALRVNRPFIEHMKQLLKNEAQQAARQPLTK